MVAGFPGIYMSSNFYEAIIIVFAGVMITVSVIRFTTAFYKNPSKAVQLIRLNKNSVKVFVMFLLMNFIFLAGYMIQLLNVSDNSDLPAILIYALGTSFFFLGLAGIISKKYIMD